MARLKERLRGRGSRRVPGRVEVWLNHNQAHVLLNHACDGSCYPDEEGCRGDCPDENTVIFAINETNQPLVRLADKDWVRIDDSGCCRWSDNLWHKTMTLSWKQLALILELLYANANSRGFDSDESLVAKVIFAGGNLYWLEVYETDDNAQPVCPVSVVYRLEEKSYGEL